MRRIAPTLALALMAAALLPAGASAQTPCGSLQFYGYEAYYVHETGMGCTLAHEIIRNVVHHGGSGHSHITCTRQVYSSSISGWHCVGHADGTDISVAWYLKFLGAHLA